MLLSFSAIAQGNSFGDAMLSSQYCFCCSFLVCPKEKNLRAHLKFFVSYHISLGPWGKVVQFGLGFNSVKMRAAYHVQADAEKKQGLSEKHKA